MAIFPGANIALSIVIGGVLFGLVFIVYSVLASAMPRSGGDYVFTSRILTPSIGFALGFAGWAFWQFFYAFLAANTIVVGALQPLFSGLGVMYHSPTLTSIANWLSETGPRLGITIVLLMISGWIMLRGLRLYIHIQNYFMMPVTIIALVVIVLEFLLVSHSTFIHHFNHFESSTGGLSSSNLLPAAKAAGYHAVGFSWSATWGFSVLLAGALLWCMWQTELMGEMKSAKSMRNTAGGMLGADFLLMVTLLIGIAWLYQYAGKSFIGPFSYLATNDPAKLGGGWGFRGVETLLALPAANGILLILIFLGFLGPISQSMFNTTLTASRLYLSMSFDRVLPAKMGEVNRRGAPSVAVTVSVGISIVLAIIYAFDQHITEAIFTASVASLIAMLGTVVAGTIFPYRMRAVYELSPAAKYKIAGLPAVTVIGGLATVFIAATTAFFIYYPGFGLRTSAAIPGWIVMGVLFLLAPIWFWTVKAVRRRHGIRLEYAFKEIPPE
jgi:amino acid transporter